MDITLHIGAHRTATTSFQRYLRDHGPALSAQGLAVWGPLRTRNRLFDGLHDQPTMPRRQARVHGRIAMNLEKARLSGVRHLVVTDENMIGLPPANLRDRALYPAIGLRMARLHAAFGARVGQVVLSIRALDLYWASLLAHLVRSGFAAPGPATRAAIAGNRRGWAEVVRDLACAMPGVAITVVPFERIADSPDRLLQLMTGLPCPPVPGPQGYWANRSLPAGALAALLDGRGERLAGAAPGRWMPFTAGEAAQLRDTHAEDLAWLMAGADGMARYIDDPVSQSAAPDGRSEPQTRGHIRDEGSQGRQSRLA